MSGNMGRVIVFVGVALIIGLLSIATLAAMGRTIPDILQVVTASSLTGLVGLLANPNHTTNGRTD